MDASQPDGLGEASTTDLIGRASAQLSTLVRDELALARAELVAKGKRAGFAGGLFGAAALLAVYGIGLLVALVVVLLHVVWPLWLSVLVTMAVVLVVAGCAALAGRVQLRRAVPPVPSQAVAGVAADVQAVTDAVREGRQE